MRSPRRRASPSQLGFADVWVSDHIAIPAAQDYPSPYLYDPLLTLAWAAAATERVGLGTSVLVVPQHNPLALANALASLDALSRRPRSRSARASAGRRPSSPRSVSRSPTAAGAWTRCSTSCAACWGPDPVDFQGEFVHLDAMKVQPKPAHPIPIWVGGRSEPAFRRAAARGDGFHAIGLDPEGAAASSRGCGVTTRRSRSPSRCAPGWDPQGMDPDVIRRERDEFEAAGIQHVVSAPWRNDSESWMRSMEMLAELVLGR